MVPGLYSFIPKENREVRAVLIFQGAYLSSQDLEASELLRFFGQNSVLLKCCSVNHVVYEFTMCTMSHDSAELGSSTMMRM